MIRIASPNDAQGLTPLAVEFFREADLPSKLVPDLFESNWRTMIGNGSGVALVSCDGETITGAIGGLIYNDLNDGEKCFAEAFWFVPKSSRGGGIRLLKAMSKWCESNGVKRSSMVHLHCLNDRLGSLYERMGWSLVESTYVKKA